MFCMIFCEGTKKMILYTVIDIIVKNYQKNFGQHLLQICCSTTVIVKFDIIFFAKIAQRARMAIFYKTKLSLLCHILFLRTSISFVSTKKTCWYADKRHNQKPARKKICPKFQLIFHNLHDTQCACCTFQNVAILLLGVVYDLNNKFW